jgi:hypothetical protein
VPSERVQALRAAFDTTMKDPEFLREMSLRLDVRPLSGAEVEDVVREVYASPPEIVKIAAGAGKISASDIWARLFAEIAAPRQIANELFDITCGNIRRWIALSSKNRALSIRIAGDFRAIQSKSRVNGRRTGIGADE